MKVEDIFIKELDKTIRFYIGKDKHENFEIIDCADKEDIWFHANTVSSCHVVCETPLGLHENDLIHIISVGGMLCKMNTNKLKTCKNVGIIYTKIKNVKKTKVVGCVITQDTKTIMC